MEQADGAEPARAVARSRRMHTFYRSGFFAWAALVVAISAGAYTGLLPTSLPSFEGADKIGHFFLIGGLGFFLDGALRRRALTKRPFEIPLAPVAVLVVAGVEEYLQRLSPRRDSSFGDFAADVAGVIALTYLSRWFARWIETRASAAAPMTE